MTTGAISRTRTAIREAAVALAAGVAAVAGSYAATGFTPAFVAAPVSDLVVALTPGAVITWAIQTLGDLGQRLAFLLALALTVGGFALAVGVAGRLAARSDAPSAPAAALAALAVALGLTGALVPGLAAGAGAGLVVAIAGAEISGDARPSAVRRRVLRAVAASAAVGGVGVILGTRRGDGPSGASAESDGEVAAEVESLLADADAKSLDVAGLEGLVSDDFYQVDINSVNPTVDAEEWSLRVTGAVENGRVFDYDDVTGMDAERRFVTLRCVGESLNGKKMDTALWTGVPVTELFDWDELPEECCVMVRAADDYFEGFPLAALEDALLAYEMNGEPLPRGHGHPVRLLVPGHWGEINVKWVTEFEVLAEEQDGYWEKRGWHGTGPVETVAKLHAVNHLDDGRVQVGGHAYAGTRGIETVEVSTDGGETWREATLSDPLPGATREGASTSDGPASAHDAWRQWEHTYEADSPHEVVVRATDGTGDLQPREETDAFPSGPTGWVSRRVEP